MNINNFLIDEVESIRHAIAMIEKNHHGVIFSYSCNKVVTGVATDGDIRRLLLNGGSLDDSVMKAINTNFIWQRHTASRETILKMFDSRIRVIPLLDSKHRLVKIVSRDYLPVQPESAIYARSRSPVRISFGGGGSDVTHFFSGDSGAVINATISLFSHATLRRRNDPLIRIKSLDLNETLTADNLDALLEKNGRFGLIQSILKTINPEFGFDLYLHSDFPVGSGLGGSAAVSAAVLGCFNQFRQDKWDSHELAELAYQSERLYYGISGGWQDQYATVFGGFNFMEFHLEQNIVHPLRIPNKICLELEESLILCNTGVAHNSGEIHLDQEKASQDAEIHEKVQSNVDLTYKMRNFLLRGKLLEFGISLNYGWQLKRQFSQKITNPFLDQIYDGALENGAIGGKLLGAGGGGFFLFYASPFQKHQLVEWLQSKKLKIHPFTFNHEGLRAWSAREDHYFGQESIHEN